MENEKYYFYCIYKNIFLDMYKVATYYIFLNTLNRQFSIRVTGLLKTCRRVQKSCIKSTIDLYCHKRNKQSLRQQSLTFLVFGPFHFFHCGNNQFKISNFLIYSQQANLLEVSYKMGKTCIEIVMLYLSRLPSALSSPCAQVLVIFICMSLLLPFPDAKNQSSKHWAAVRCFVKMGEPLWQFRSKDFTQRVHMHIPAYYSQAGAWDST